MSSRVSGQDRKTIFANLIYSLINSPEDWVWDKDGSHYLYHTPSAADDVRLWVSDIGWSLCYVINLNAKKCPEVEFSYFQAWQIAMVLRDHHRPSSNWVGRLVRLLNKIPAPATPTPEAR